LGLWLELYELKFGGRLFDKRFRFGCFLSQNFGCWLLQESLRLRFRNGFLFCNFGEGGFFFGKCR